MSDKTITSIENGMSIIELVISNGGMTQTEVREELDWSKAKTHYYMKTLRKCGLIVQREREYFAGLGLATYGRAAIEQTELVHPLRTVVDDLAAETDKLALLAVEQNDEIYYVYQSEAGDSAGERNLVGKAREPHCTAFGKVILANVDENRREALLADVEFDSDSQCSNTSEAELRRELEQIRENDFAYDEAEFEPSIRGIAAPIWDTGGERLLGSLGVISSEEPLEDPYSGTKAQRFAKTDANIVKRFAKTARNKLDGGE
ncbi:IclR family transcriptional regulator [Halosimplex aquaticum]|uniref:IclR family transcriptional regulator n=1 Tax=Halosimplex aquaticum TaxID=3026162 RepID=A0ABD5XUH0_9EURY|nr:IclR family transcriptional regulator [Halosimplex aquaticum]